MIKVTVGNNVKRESVIVNPNSTLRAVLEQANVDYTRGVMHLDGSSLNPGDLDNIMTPPIWWGLLTWEIGGIGRHDGLKYHWFIRIGSSPISPTICRDG